MSTTKKQVMQEIISNINYFKWLEKFTTEHQSFYDNQWIYLQQEISTEDRENMWKLHLMYEIIRKYAIENDIYPTLLRDLGHCYKIKLDSTGYRIGMVWGLEVSYFCERVHDIDEQDFIDFNDIINNKKRNNVDKIEDNLKELSNMIISLYKSGINPETITDTVNNTLNKITLEKKNRHTRKLKKHTEK